MFLRKKIFLVLLQLPTCFRLHAHPSIECKKQLSWKVVINKQPLRFTLLSERKEYSNPSHVFISYALSGVAHASNFLECYSLVSIEYGTTNQYAWSIGFIQGGRFKAQLSFQLFDHPSEMLSKQASWSLQIGLGSIRPGKASSAHPRQCKLRGRQEDSGFNWIKLPPFPMHVLEQRQASSTLYEKTIQVPGIRVMQPLVEQTVSFDFEKSVPLEEGCLLGRRADIPHSEARSVKETMTIRSPVRPPTFGHREKFVERSFALNERCLEQLHRVREQLESDASRLNRQVPPLLQRTRPHIESGLSRLNERPPEPSGPAREVPFNVQSTFLRKPINRRSVSTLSRQTTRATKMVGAFDALSNR